MTNDTAKDNPYVEVRSAAEDAANAAPPKVVWNDQNMTTTHANVCNVLGTREEISVLFGTNQTWYVDGAQKEINVQLSHRIVLNPYTARRLQTMLEMAMREYETRYGALRT